MKTTLPEVRQQHFYFDDSRGLWGQTNKLGAHVIYLGTKFEPDSKPLHGKYFLYDNLNRKLVVHITQGESHDLKVTMIDVDPNLNRLGNPRSFCFAKACYTPGACGAAAAASITAFYCVSDSSSLDLTPHLCIDERNASLQMVLWGKPCSIRDHLQLQCRHPYQVTH